MGTVVPILKEMSVTSQVEPVSGDVSFSEAQALAPSSTQMMLSLEGFYPTFHVDLLKEYREYAKILGETVFSTPLGALTQMDIDGLTKLIETQNFTLGRIESKLDKVDGRLGEVEQRLSKIEGHMPSLATQSQVSSVKSDLQTEMNKGLSPLQTDVTSIKTEISHHATKSWVYVTLAVASAGALAAIGSIFTIINSLPKH